MTQKNNLLRLFVIVVSMFFVSSNSVYSIADWNQFEEDYNVVYDFDNDIRPIYSNSFPQDSYGVLHLDDTKDKISQEFYVNESGKYRIEMISYTGYKTPDAPYTRLDRTNVYINNVLQEKIKGDESSCYTVWNWQYCLYFVEVELNSGINKLEIESNKARLRLDKFRIENLDNPNPDPDPDPDPEPRQDWITIQEDTIPIFGYHEILDDNKPIQEPNLEIHVSDFENQMQYATNTLNCNWITFGDLLEYYILVNKKIPQNSCLITFDDATIDQYENAYPILEKYNIDATFFAIYNRIDDNNYMDLAQLKELEDNGHEIASHTKSHVRLTNLDNQYLEDEILNSKILFEEEGFNIRTFAYPYGDFNQEVIDKVKSSGYLGARDISKDNSWRRKPSITTSAKDDYYLYTFNYYKPEKASNEDLKEDIFYNYWYQFEENYRIDETGSGNIYTYSTLRPTSTSYATMNLDPGYKITTSFLVYEKADYMIEIIGYTGYNTPDTPYARLDRTNIYINNNLETKHSGNESNCNTVWNWQYCPYYVLVTLDEGYHELSIEPSGNGRIRIDKFAIHQNIIE